MCSSLPDVITLKSSLPLLLSIILLIKKLISQSSAVTFLYEGVVKKELSNGKLAHVKIKDYQLQHPLYFIYRKGDPKYYIYEKIFQSLT